MPLAQFSMSGCASTCTSSLSPIGTEYLTHSVYLCSFRYTFPLPPVAAAAIVCSVFSPSLLTCVRRISPHFPMDILPYTNICLQYTIRHTANFNPMFASCDVAIKRLAKNEQAAQTCCPSRSPVGDREVFIASHRPPCTTSLRMPCHRRGCRCAHHCAGAHRTAAL